MTTHDTDRAFCAELLPRVSRTFALSIEALPAELREAVRVSYLLCRVVDTVEDTRGVAPRDRQQLFDLFDALMADDGADPGPFERRCGRQVRDAAAEERRLCAGAGAVFREFRALPPAQREAIRPHVAEMSRGMREYSLRGGGEHRLRLRDMEDLERYCYFVAGTVGQLLTALFEQHVPDLDPYQRERIRARAVSFGLGLQLVNIVKDVAADHARGDCFLPLELMRGAGTSPERLLDPRRREQALAVVREVCARAREHLAAAREYTELWPVPGGEQIRLFCAVPLALALATLREVEHGADTLRPDRVPKVSRELVSHVLLSAREAVTSNDALGSMLGR